jgi:acid phosphatase type 7
MYVSADYESDGKFAEGIQKELEGIFFEYKVDLYVSGHYHSYERTCKMFNYQCVEGGTVHIMAGSTGYIDKKPWKEPKPAWSMNRIQKLGFAKFQILDDILQIDFINSITGLSEDRFQIKKSL